MARHPLLYSVLTLFLILAILFGFLSFVLTNSSGSSSFMPFGSVAVVEIEGPIFESIKTLKELQKHRQKSSVKAVVLRIDSPGGAVAPSQEIYEEVKKLKKTKTVVVSMGTVAASGAYYIACAADKVLASKGTITGSIGVIMESFGLQEVTKFLRLEPRILKSGKYKDTGSPFRPMTESDKRYLQQIIDNMYNQFKTDVAASRGLDAETVESIAQGKIYSGEQALEAGLIDGLGTLYDAIDMAKQMAGLPADARVVWPKENRFLKWLDDSGSKTLTQWVQKLFYKFDLKAYALPEPWGLKGVGGLVHH